MLFRSLEEVATLLARFQPTAVAVERLAADPATMLDQQYPAFKPADLTTSPDERVQVGYRLAAKLKLARVYAIDEQDRPGEVSYFPFEELMAWAAAHGRQSELEDSVRGASAFATELEAKQVTHTVGELLAEFNAPDAPMCAAGNGLYMQLVSYGSGSDQPGAVLNGRWFTRNAMIFAKLTQVAKPGDRIVVIYGGGHAYWLRNLVAQMPGYRLIEAVDFLPARKK